MLVGPVGFIVSSCLVRATRAGWGRCRPRTAGGICCTGAACSRSIALAVALPALGVLPWQSVNSVILLIVALAYFTAGVHGERRFLWVGVLMAGGYVLVTLVSGYAWTIVGVTLAVALIVAGLRGGRPLEAAP